MSLTESELIECGVNMAAPSPPARRHRRWALAFYAPAVVFPAAARLLVLAREGHDLGLASALKGGAFGCIQDAAIFLQTLVATRIVLHVRNVLLPDTASPSTVRRVPVQLAAALALSVVYLWLTLACLVDLTLLVRFLPRLNRGFVQMYLQFSSQFASSLEEVLDWRMVLGLLAYVASLVLWVSAVVFDQVQLPRFDLRFCQSTSSQTSQQPKTHAKPRRSSVSDASVFPWAVQLAAASITFRTIFLALLVAASALHATLALDGSRNDIYLLSNAMFSLEMDDLLKPTTKTHASAGVLSQRLRASAGYTTKNVTAVSANATITNTTSETTEAAPVPETPPPMNPFYERTIGRNEVFEVDGTSDSANYPFWRKTVRFSGEKRFEFQAANASAAKLPPTILLINLESFRSREVGVLGGSVKLARYNQTVTPFFNALSKTGVLFSQHYTPCVQTSRTLLSSLFGILPSMKDASAVATFAETKLRLRGLPQILKEALNYTSMFWSAVNLTWEDWRGFLLTNGFDSLVDDTEVLKYLPKKYRNALTSEDAFSWGRHDAVSFKALESFLKARRRDANAQPLFVDMYTVSSHDPWKLPASFTPSTNYSTYLTADNEKYIHALNYVDQCLNKFISNLRRKGLMENTIIMIEGDHGYGRMEHGNNPTIVASYVYEEGSHVPMLLLADDFLGDQDKGAVVDELTSQTDLMATITDMLGIENFTQHGVGQSMLRKRGPTARAREVVLSNPFYGQTRGLRVGRDLKYARYGSGKYEVFNLTSDPLEQQPVEQGTLTKNQDGAVHIGAELSETTADALHFMEQVITVAELMYETNGFVPETREPVAEGSADQSSAAATAESAA